MPASTSSKAVLLLQKVIESTPLRVNLPLTIPPSKDPAVDPAVPEADPEVDPEVPEVDPEVPEVDPEVEPDAPEVDPEGLPNDCGKLLGTSADVPPHSDQLLMGALTCCENSPTALPAVPYWQTHKSPRMPPTVALPLPHPSLVESFHTTCV